MRIIENRGNWYKGNMHMHTTESDGVLDPVEAIGVYREAGYDFIAITDHRRVGHLWQDDDFLILPGVEWDTGDVRNAPVYHILGIGMTRDTVDFYHGAPYEGAPLGNTRSGIIVEGKYGRKRYHPHPQAIIDAIRRQSWNPCARGTSMPAWDRDFIASITSRKPEWLQWSAQRMCMLSFSSPTLPGRLSGSHFCPVGRHLR